MKNAANRTKLCLVSSRGGHLYQMYLLKKWWEKYERVWISGKGGDVDYLLKNEHVYYGFFPESRNGVNAIRNFILGLRVLNREKPTLVLSCGAGIAPPIFIAAKLLRVPFIFVDSITFVRYPSLSARLATLLGGTVLVQHAHMINRPKGAQYHGGVL